MIREAIAMAVEGKDLDEKDAEQVMGEIMEGTATPAQIACFITALRMKGERISEITGSARAMRARVTKLHAPSPDVVDTCGTGGDRARTLNISTLAAIVAAGMGLVVAKHGNRSVSSHCGSADVMRALGVNIEASARQVERCLQEAGIGFLYAPLLHPAMKNAIGPRREIGIRTIFNILGPLTNPAGASRQLLGVYESSLVETIAAVLGRLGSSRAMVVHSEDGLDEISLSADTIVAELADGTVRTYKVGPRDFGLNAVRLEELRCEDAESSVEAARAVLAGKPGPARDVVLANSAAVAVVGGKAASFREGVRLAAQAIDSGRAKEKLEKLVELTNKPEVA